ncbi:hypothetical protein BN946_scf184990.g14 [Trametes cinnabarina]|uniref:Uncharacterized protein n=1 Tax=Pycnoporus cinnabarinus TaxID=5643 RepID=A0A060SEU2_PYCCI|nr:hypothetical protein BN946_scf184990.g14 [Trametes cinnabarina]
MQNSSDYHDRSDRVWDDWDQQRASCSWDDSPSTPLQHSPRSSAIPVSYTITPPTPDSTDSDVSSSHLSTDSIPDFDDIPEIPFVSAQVAYADEWIPSSDLQAEGQAYVDQSGSEASSSFWTSLIGLKPSTSKSSDGTGSLSGSLRLRSGSALFGQTPTRSLSPERASRKRAASVSSIASSRTKPAPAKSILSSGSSAKTQSPTRRIGKAPSVKFLDMPTIHYDDDYPRDCDEDDEDEAEDGSRRASSPMFPPPKKKAKTLGGLLSLRWLFGPSKVENRSATPRPAPTSALGRPSISGPYPLWDSPSCRGHGAGMSSGASLRSMKSSQSLRSVRSCGSRLPTYWPR